MTHFDIIPLSADDAPAVRGWLAVAESVARHDLGGLRPRHPLQRLSSLVVSRDDIANERWLAVCDDRVLGYLHLMMPVLDNTHMVYFDLAVHPDERRHGIGSALLRHLEERAADLGRHSLSLWLPVPDGPESKVSAVGANFAITKGFTMSLEGAVRACDLDAVDEAALDRLWEDSWSKAEDFELVAFEGEPTEDLLDGIAYMHTRMSTDMPLGDWDFQEAEYDRERVLDEVRRHRLRGDLHLQAVVRHKETGRIAGHTEIVVEPGQEYDCIQGDTIVDSDYRGHRLGTVLKIANQRRVREWRPKMRYVWTGNAVSNTHMIAINEAVGYRLVGMENVYQKKL
ncbi:GNAT family N-acetyltransferase [Glycomyces paridis]|uniref:GNAT family N-acetyltransferase n=1 Tax=Glycomyces paridis TaxID=2126555 RepID=A0A4S8PNN2_9ACTN|nr:GNAT family N-acetyltransferase [Glycomyces paridis]THV29984.1 GNAT family N-acetyltransferase [Glycomyces paridis]